MLRQLLAISPKISGEVANLQLAFTFAFETKGLAVVTSLLIKINKRMTKLFCFLLRIFFQSEDSVILA